MWLAGTTDDLELQRDVCRIRALTVDEPRFLAGFFFYVALLNRRNETWPDAPLCRY